MTLPDRDEVRRLRTRGNLWYHAETDNCHYPYPDFRVPPVPLSPPLRMRRLEKSRRRRWHAVRHGILHGRHRVRWNVRHKNEPGARND